MRTAARRMPCLGPVLALATLCCVSFFGCPLECTLMASTEAVTLTVLNSDGEQLYAYNGYAEYDDYYVKIDCPEGAWRSDSGPNAHCATDGAVSLEHAASNHSPIYLFLESEEGERFEGKAKVKYSTVEINGDGCGESPVGKSIVRLSPRGQ